MLEVRDSMQKYYSYLTQFEIASHRKLFEKQMTKIMNMRMYDYLNMFVESTNGLRKTSLKPRRILYRKLHWPIAFLLFDSRIIRRMTCESMLSTNAEITPMHCCLGEPDCLAGIILLFKTNWHLTRRHGRGLLFEFLLSSMMYVQSW